MDMHLVHCFTETCSTTQTHGSTFQTRCIINIILFLHRVGCEENGFCGSVNGMRVIVHAKWLLFKKLIPIRKPQ